MTPAQVLQFERRGGRGGPPADYGRFAGELSADEWPRASSSMTPTGG